MGKVSVCMATYNGERFVKKQLQTILKQLDTDDEVIISDDSSTDNTVSIIKSLKDNRIVLHENQKYANHCRNFEYELRQSNNEYIFLSDQDDEWVDGKVASMLAALQDNDMVVCDYSIIDQDGKILLPSYFQKFPYRATPGIIRNLWRHSYSGCCMAFSRKLLNFALPFPKHVDYHDYWLGFIANLFYKVSFIKIPLTRYRSHSDNVSFGPALKSGNNFFRKVEIRMNVIRYLPLLIIKKLNNK